LAIEDYGVLLTLPKMSVYVPAFDSDIESVITRAANEIGPAYIRLGRGEIPANYVAPTYSPWRQLTSGEGPVVIVIGPVVGRYIESINQLDNDSRPALWVLSELPLIKNKIPEVILRQIYTKKQLIIIEEHVSRGSFASEFALHLLTCGVHLDFFKQLCATRHIFDSYGSQNFLRDCSGLGVSDLMNLLESL
jgi:transketolase